MCEMKKVLVIILLQVLIVKSSAQPLPFPYNLDFEVGELGKLPKGWVVPSYADNLGYVAYLSDEEPKSGRFCLELYRAGTYKEDMYGSVMQSIDAKPYRGKTIVFRAYVRAEIHSPKGSAHIWVRERVGKNEELGFLEYLPLQPVVVRNWELREIKTTISPDADVINFGLLLFGNGKAWIDNASFEIIPSESSVDLPHKIDTSVVGELVDLAKVFGVVRYFNPLSEKTFNWECFLRNSVSYLLENRSQSISKKIHYLFHEFLDLDDVKKRLSDTSGYVSWLHFGFPIEKEHPFVYSKKVNNLNPLRNYQGIVQQTLNVSGLQGKDIIFSTYIKGKLFEQSSRIVLAIRFDDGNNKQIGYLFREFKKVEENKWSNFELNGKIPETAMFAKLALVLVGEGNVFFDDVFFGENDGSKTNLLQNPGFENSRDSLLVYNWRLLDISSQSGYYAFVRAGKGRGDTKALHLYSDDENRISLPRPFEKFEIRLIDGFSVEIPISVPVAALDSFKYKKKNYEEIDCEYNFNDIISQLSILIDIWNFMVHFNEYFGRNLNVDSLLSSTIKECILSYTDNQKNAEKVFLKILEKFVAHSKDNFTRILHKDYLPDKSLPFLWKYIDGNVYITKIGENVDTLDVGDKVIALNSIPIEKVIDSISNFVGFSSDSWKPLKSLAYIRNFFLNDTIKIKLMKPNGKIVDKIVVKDPESNQIYEDRPERFQFLSEKVVYFDLTRLVEKEIKDILDTLNHKGYFIFDLRGIALTSEQFLSLFTDKTIECNAWKIPVFAFPFKQKISWQTIKLKINGKSLFNPKGIYFLIDERTIGIAEVIADIAKRYKIGTLVGCTTGGNPMEFGSKIFPNGLTLYFGVLRVFSCGEEDKYRKGIVPNVPVKIKFDKDSLLRDQILDRVLYLINSNQ